MQKTVFLILSYLLGSIPFGLIVGKAMRGVDIRQFGSGNIGATNVYRTLGPGPGITVFAADVLKGLAPVLLAKHFVSDATWFVVVTGLMAILGHTLSPFLKFKGGKGVATSLGVGLGLVPLAAAIALGIWVVLFAVTRYVSVASMVGCGSVPFVLWWTGADRAYLVFGVFVAAYVVIKHRENIVRLAQGRENRFGRKAPTDGNTGEG